jgi:hypothetical protein
VGAVLKVHEADDHTGWWVEATKDEPEEVRQAAEAITRDVRSGLRGIPRTETLIQALERSRADAKRNAGEPTDRMRKAMFALAREIELTRQDRLDLAELVLERDVETWGDLSFDEASKLLTAMNGYLWVRHLRTRR